MRRNLGLLGVALWLIGCGASGIGAGGDRVGGPCSAATQCVSICYMDRHYPGGMCTAKCASDLDCPSGTACVDEDQNVCAVVCANNGECAAFGRGFICDARDRVGAPGGVTVCRVP